MSKDTFVRVLCLFSFLLLLHIGFTAKIFCWDRPFNNAANWGGTGLMEIPNARVLEEGVIRLGVAQALPYRWYSGSMGVFPGLELGFRLTEMTNLTTRLGPAYGAYKDKALDVKYQIREETKGFPAMAIGVHDFWGTRLFPAEYLVFSRQIFPLDITLGFGRKRLHGPLSIPILDDFGLFGGIELALHERLHILAEYNPIEYEKDKKKAIPEGVRSPINIGLKARILPGMDLGLSYQRGDTLGLMFHLQVELGKPILPQTPDPPPRVSIDRRPFHERDQRDMIKKIHEAIRKAGFSDVSVYTDGRDIVAEFDNTKYMSDQKAVGRVLRILLFHSPSDTGQLSVVVRRRDMPILKVTVKPDYLEKFLLGKIPGELFYSKLLDIEIVKQTVDQPQNYIRTEREKEFRFNFNIKPEFQMYLNDPSGFFKFRPGIKPYITTNVWKGALAFARYDIPFYSNISSSNIPLPDAVRSDSWYYSGKDYSFDRLIIDQAFRLSKKTFGRLSLGYLEKMYAGIGGEVLCFLGEGNLTLGVEADWVRKREPATQFALMDFERYTFFGNIYYHLTRPDLTLHAQYGKFLAGDIGWMLNIRRRYDTGVILGMWWSFTDTDHLTGFNRGYNNKGISLSLPVRMFLPYDSRGRYSYSFAPWTRDVAGTVFHWQNLFELGKDLMPADFKAKLNKINK